MKSWSLHGCGWMSFSAVCREYGVPRIHLQTPWWHLGIAVTPSARFVGDGTRISWVDFSRRPAHYRSNE